MLFYKVELDGFSWVKSDVELEEQFGMLVSVTNNGETSIYRIKEIKNDSLKLTMTKFVSDVEEETKFSYIVDGETLYFSNRLSKNQTISFNSKLCKVINVKGSELELEYLETLELSPVFPVYESGIKRTLDNVDFLFFDWGQALIYIAKQREKGRRVSF